MFLLTAHPVDLLYRLVGWICSLGQNLKVQGCLLSARFKSQCSRKVKAVVFALTSLKAMQCVPPQLCVCPLFAWCTVDPRTNGCILYCSCILHPTHTHCLPTGSKASFIGPSELRIEVNFVAGVKCGNMAKAAACIFVPGIAPDSTAGRNAAAEYALIEQRKPTKGWQMTVEGGKMCKVSKGVNRPRKTTFRFRCDPNKAVAPEDWPKLAWEGGPQADSQICHYFVEVHSPYGCPTLNSPGTSLPPNQEDTKSQKNAGSNANHHNRQPSPAPAPASAQPLATITAVSGCTDTDPVSVTTGCSAEGGTTLSIHGTYLIEPTRGQKTSVLLRGGVVGGAASSKGLECHPVTWVSAWELKCSLPEGKYIYIYYLYILTAIPPVFEDLLEPAQTRILVF